MRRPLLALAALALSLGLSGCISTTGVDEEAPSLTPTVSPSPTPTPTPTPTPEPEASADPSYRIPAEAPLEASRLIFERDAVGVDPVTSLNVASSAVRGQDYVLEFDCTPSDASITLSLSPAAGEDDPPATVTGPVSVTHGCSASGRATGIRVNRMVGVQISLVTDDAARAWAVLQPAD